MYIEPKSMFCHEADIAFAVDRVPVAPKEMVVGVAQGQTKCDHRDDGDEIQELDEFEIAAFQDQANFIKIFSVTNEYQSTYNLSFNESLFLNLKKLWYNKRGVLKLLSRFSDQFITQIDRKLLEGNSINYFSANCT